MTNLKVSIIIPVYNAQEYLKECVESAINQDYQPCEVIFYLLFRILLIKIIV